MDNDNRTGFFGHTSRSMALGSSMLKPRSSKASTRFATVATFILDRRFFGKRTSKKIPQSCFDAK